MASHYVRVIKLTADGRIVTQDLGKTATAEDYTNDNLPPGVAVNEIAYQSTTTSASLALVRDVQTQVDVGENGVVIDTNQPTTRELRNQTVATAKSTLTGIEASQCDADTKTMLRALCDAIWPDGSTDPPLG